MEIEAVMVSKEKYFVFGFIRTDMENIFYSKTQSTSGHISLGMVSTSELIGQDGSQNQ